MTVGELIERLRGLPEGMHVLVDDSVFLWDIDEMEVKEVISHTYEMYPGWVETNYAVRVGGVPMLVIG